ncbi:MAG: CvpA family protein [Bacteroidota bacterium]
MNAFDLVILAVLIVFALLGAWRGLVSEVIGILQWVISGVIAWFFASSLSDIFQRFVGEPALRKLLAFILIFVVVFTLGVVVSWLIRKSLPAKRGFRIANAILGGMFGTARGAFAILIVFLAAGLTTYPQRSWWRESSLAPFFERSALYVSGYLPDDIARHIRYS